MNSKNNHWLAAFTSRDFRLLWIGELISALSTAAFSVSFRWQMYQLTHSALALGLIGLADFLPLMAFSLFGGVAADRYNRKKILYITQSTIVLCSWLMALTTFTHIVTPLLMYVLTALVAVVVAFDLPARQALLPHLVEKHILLNALSMYQMLWQISSIIGPALAGIFIALIGIPWLYSLDGLTTITVILMLFLIGYTGDPVDVPAERTASSPISLPAIKEGLLFVRRQPVIWSTILLDFCATLFTSATTLLPVYASSVLHVGPQILGLLFAAPALGSLLTATLVAHRGQRIRYKGRLLLLVIAAFAVLTLLFAFSRNLLLSLLALLLAGGCGSVSVILRNTMQQQVTPDAVRGRVSSIIMLFYMGGPQLGQLEAGWLAAIIGPVFSLAVGGLATLAVVAAVTVAVPALRAYYDKMTQSVSIKRSE